VTGEDGADDTVFVRSEADEVDALDIATEDLGRSNESLSLNPESTGLESGGNELPGFFEARMIRNAGATIDLNANEFQGPLPVKQEGRGSWSRTDRIVGSCTRGGGLRRDCCGE
jgi:hypothetical protein